MHTAGDVGSPCLHIHNDVHHFPSSSPSPHLDMTVSNPNLGIVMSDLLAIQVVMRYLIRRPVLYWLSQDIVHCPEYACMDIPHTTPYIRSYHVLKLLFLKVRPRVGFQ